MLKSHLHLGQNEPEAEEEEPEETPESASTQEEKEEEQVIVERILNKSEISVRLSWLGKTAEGTGYTYLKLKCTEMSLTQIKVIKCFLHLQFVDFSDNFLTIDALNVVTKLPYILLVQADKNRLESANLNKCKFLQVIIMNQNKIKSVFDVYQPELTTLEVGYNQITEIKFLNRMPTLKVLDFRYNLIRDLIHLDFPNLDSLYLAGNKITNLTGINKLPNLRILHVRNNPIKYLHGFETNLPKLEYINFRNCKIGIIKQIKKLRTQTGLQTLVLKGTPYMGGTGKEGDEGAGDEDDAEARVEVLAALPRLKKLNKLDYTDEERAEAKEIMSQWIEEGEDIEEEVGAEHGEEQQAEDAADT